MSQRVSIGTLSVDLLFRDMTTDGLRRLERGVDRAERRLQTASKVALGFGAALSGALISTLTPFAKLEAKISEVAAKTGLAARDLRQNYLAEIQAISEATGQADLDLLDGLQKALSAGLRGAGALDAVRVAAESAAAGIGGIGDQISAATTLTTIFGGSAGDALDIIARAAQVGEGETQDFAQAMKVVAGFAEALGLEATETAGAMAAISQVAPSVSEGATQLRSFLQSIMAPTDAARKALKGLGGDFTDLQAIAREKGIAAVVAELHRLVGDNAEALTKVLGRTEAEAFFLSVDATQLTTLADEVESTFRGTIAGAFAEGANDINRNLAQLRASFKGLRTDVGKEIAPAALDIIKALQGVVKALAALPTPVKRLAGYAALAGPALLGLGFAFRMAAAGIGPLYMGMLNLATMPTRPMATITSKVKGLGKALVGLGRGGWIGLVVGGLVLIATHWDRVTAAVRRAISRVKDFFSEEGQQRRATDRALDAHTSLVGTLEDQLRVLQDQGAPMADQLDLARRIKAEREEMLQLEQESLRMAERRAAKEARDVAIPGLQDQIARLDREIKNTEADIRLGIPTGPHSTRPGVPLEGAALATAEGTRSAAETEKARLQEELGRAWRVAMKPGQEAFEEHVKDRFGEIIQLPAAGAAGGETVASILGDEWETGTGTTPTKPDDEAGRQARVPAPERVEVRNQDVVEAVWDQTSRLVQELRALGISVTGEDLSAYRATLDRLDLLQPPETPPPTVTAEVPAPATTPVEPLDDVTRGLAEAAQRQQEAVEPRESAPVASEPLGLDDVARGLAEAAQRPAGAEVGEVNVGAEVAIPEIMVKPAAPIPLPEAVGRAMMPAHSPVEPADAAPVAPNPFQSMNRLADQALHATAASTVNNNTTSNRVTNANRIRWHGDIHVTAQPGQNPEEIAAMVRDEGADGDRRSAFGRL